MCVCVGGGGGFRVRRNDPTVAVLILSQIENGQKMYECIF